MTDMQGPSDEIGFVKRNPAHDGLTYLSEITALGPVEDTPVEGQAHLRAPEAPAYLTGDPIRDPEKDGEVDGTVVSGEEILALAALIPRGQRRHVDEVLDADRRAEEEREAVREHDRRLAASRKIPDRLELYMKHQIYSKMRYDDFAEAEDMLRDVLAALRGEIPHRPDLNIEAALHEAWDDGYAEGEGYISACCGCSGMGEPPTNPYGDGAAPPLATFEEVRAKLAERPPWALMSAETFLKMLEDEG